MSNTWTRVTDASERVPGRDPEVLWFRKVEIRYRQTGSLVSVRDVREFLAAIDREELDDDAEVRIFVSDSGSRREVSMMIDHQRYVPEPPLWIDHQRHVPEPPLWIKMENA